MKAFESKKLSNFKFAFEFLNADVSAPLSEYNGLNIFELVLQTPNMSEFIEMCIMYGAKLYQVSGKK